MNDLIRSGIYVGVGTLVQARKKLEELVEELIQNNELTRDEGRRVVQDMIHKAEDIRNDTERLLLNTIDSFLMNSPLPPRHELEVRCQDFIEQLNQLRNKSLFSSRTDDASAAGGKPVANS